MTFPFPTPITVCREPWCETTTDPLGNSTFDYGTAEELPAYSIAPHVVEQGAATITETEVADLDVYMPKTEVSVKDRFMVDGKPFEVVGVQDWTRGFHGWDCGIVVQLKKVS